MMDSCMFNVFRFIFFTDNMAKSKIFLKNYHNETSFLGGNPHVVYVCPGKFFPAVINTDLLP